MMQAVSQSGPSIMSQYRAVSRIICLLCATGVKDTSPLAKFEQMHALMDCWVERPKSWTASSLRTLHRCQAIVDDACISSIGMWWKQDHFLGHTYRVCRHAPNSPSQHSQCLLRLELGTGGHRYFPYTGWTRHGHSMQACNDDVSGRCM